MLELPEEIRLLKQTVREFVQRELIPWERRHPDGRVPNEDLARVQAAARELGLWLLDVPAELGGAGLGPVALCAVWEELHRTPLARRVAPAIFGPTVGPVLLHANGSQRDRYLAPVLRGDRKTALAYGEDLLACGPEPGGVRGAQSGSGWVLHGPVRYGTWDGQVDFLQVPARSAGGAVWALLDLDAPGVQVARVYRTAAGQTVMQLDLAGVAIPGDRIVGGEEEGIPLAHRALSLLWLQEAAEAVGVADRALAMAAAYARERVTFGKPLAERQAIQFMLVDAVTELRAARLQLYECAARLERGVDVAADAAMVRVYAVEMASRAVDRAMQIHGGTGLTTDLPLGTWFVALRDRRVVGWTAEALRTFAAGALLAG